MSKKYIVTICAVLAVLGVFLPWLSMSAFGYQMSLNGMSEQFSADGILLILFAVALGVLSVIELKNKNMQQILMIVFSALLVVLPIGNIMTNQKVVDLGAKVGFGLYLIILAGGVATVFSVLNKMGRLGDVNEIIDGQAIKDATQKGVDIAKVLGKAATDAAKTAVDSAKTELAKKDNKDDKDNKDTEEKGNE